MIEAIAVALARILNERTGADYTPDDVKWDAMEILAEIIAAGYEVNKEPK